MSATAQTASDASTRSPTPLQSLTILETLGFGCDCRNCQRSSIPDDEVWGLFFSKAPQLPQPTLHTESVQSDGTRDASTTLQDPAASELAGDADRSLEGSALLESFEEDFGLNAFDDDDEPLLLSKDTHGSSGVSNSSALLHEESLDASTALQDPADFEDPTGFGEELELNAFADDDESLLLDTNDSSRVSTDQSSELTPILIEDWEHGARDGQTW